MRYVLVLSVLGLVLATAGVPPVGVSASAPAASHEQTPPSRARRPLLSSVRVPVAFEANRGQADPRAEYVAHADGYSFFLSPTEAVFVPTIGRPEAALRLRLRGASDAPAFEPSPALAGRANYLRGNDSKKWVRDVPRFASIARRDVYPGVDQTWTESGGRVELGFVVHPGADPASIVLDYDGVSSLQLDDDGRLVAGVTSGEFVQSRPIAYQGEGPDRVPVAVRYTRRDGAGFAFALGEFDRARPLVIDPEFSYVSYFGAEDGDGANAIAVDAAGAIYLTGGTDSFNLPTDPGVVQPEFAAGDVDDAFVAKFAPGGASLVYVTYLGGDDEDDDDEFGLAITADGAGRAHVSGITDSTDFPTMNPVQADWGGNEDVFVSVLSADGTALVFSTYLGGAAGDFGEGIALDASGTIYLAGETSSTDFPVVSPMQATLSGGRDAFVARIENGVLVYSTYFGGSSIDGAAAIAVDPAATSPAGSEILISGSTRSADFPLQNPFQGTLVNENATDAFVTRIQAGGAALVNSTFLGGSERDEGLGIARDAAGNAYVVGSSRSADFPTVGAAQAQPGGSDDGFITKLSPAGAVSYSTLLGGSLGDKAHAVAVDGAGRPWIVGETASDDFPLAEAAQTEFGGETDAFVTELFADGSALLFSTYLGGIQREIGRGVALGPGDTVQVTGDARGNFPTTSGAYQEDYADAGGANSFAGDAFFATLGEPGGTGNVPPPNTIRSFVLPKKVQVTLPVAGKKAKKPGVKLTAFFDSGPDEVDLSDPATLTLGPKTFDIPALTPVKGGSSFGYEGQGLKLDIRPSKLGTSKGKLKLRFEGDLGAGTDLDGPFAIRFQNDSGIDAKGECVLSSGGFIFGRSAGELIAPEISIRKAKAKLPGVGRHTFKFVAGFTTQGAAPNTAPDIQVALGDVFNADIPSSALQLKGNNFKLQSSVAGIDALALTYLKERISVRGGNVDLGDIADGPVPVLLIFSQGEDVRAVFVRMVRKGKSLKY